MTATFRIQGVQTTSQNLFTIENNSTTASPVTITIRRLILQMDATGALTIAMPQFKTSRLTGTPSGGFTPTAGVLYGKIPFDSATTSSTYVVMRQAAYGDGTTATTAITCTPAFTAWQQFGFRMHTVVGQVMAVDCDMLPVLVADNGLAPFKIGPYESIGIQMVTATTTSNPTTNWFFINCVWEEV